MRIFNTLTRKMEEFAPQVENEVKMYACGPTVYNLIHIGNARPIITFDTSKYHNGDIDTLISRFNVPDIDRWSDDSLYNWCQNGHKLYKKRRIGNTDTVLPYKYYGVADSKGVLKYELPYPALLIVNAIKVDALKDSLDNITGYVRHTGTIQVELKENETVSKPIYMLRTN